MNKKKRNTTAATTTTTITHAPDSRGRSEQLGRGERRGAYQRVQALRLGELSSLVLTGLVNHKAIVTKRNTPSVTKSTSGRMEGSTEKSRIPVDLERPIADPAVLAEKPNAVSVICYRVFIP